ncbi:hypothetical protein ACEWY4_008818 [Coilia grayii]|uniref:RING-type E3 ubiquitin transferase n=1 Tax=Coilia grayii TaxID=363190 RepID=A0ABD1KBW3_9TELE
MPLQRMSQRIYNSLLSSSLPQPPFVLGGQTVSSEVSDSGDVPREGVIVVASALPGPPLNPPRHPTVAHSHQADAGEQPSSSRTFIVEPARLQREPPSEPRVDASVHVEEATAQQLTEYIPGPASLPPAPSSPPDKHDDDEAVKCPICFDPWTRTGEHCLTALPCGHLFGFACIQNWLRVQAKCPMCKQICIMSDILLLKFGVDRVAMLKRDLIKWQSSRCVAEQMRARLQLRLQEVEEECNMVHEEVQGYYTFSTTVMVSKAGGCRVMAFSEPLSCLLASKPAARSLGIPGFGVEKISTATMKVCQYVPVHLKPIRGLAVSRQHDNLLLSCSLDNTLKLTSLSTNTVVQTCKAGTPVWSCCWSHDDNNCVYAGLCNGTVRVYDVRDTSTHVHELHGMDSRCPVLSLAYMPRAASSDFPMGGLVASSQDVCCFLERKDGTTYKSHWLPPVQGRCTDIQVEPDSRQFLVTYRLGKSQEQHSALMKMSCTTRGCSALPMRTFSTVGYSSLLTKNTIFKNPANGATIVCTGDKSSKTTTVWDVASGGVVQKLCADYPVLDICSFQTNQSHYLACLSEKEVKVYKFIL